MNIRFRGHPLPVLSELNVRSDNNLTLLRVVAALSVLLSHSFLTVTGDPDSRPLIALTGNSIGFHAVNTFFFVSGFLVAQSWLRQSSLLSFAVARSLRIYPALIANVLIVTFILGLMMTTLSASDYLQAIGTFKYLLQTASLIEPSGNLPGVFARNPDPSTVNGSLWTLRYEVISYAALAIIGLLGILKRPRIFFFVFLLGAVGLGFASTQPIGHDYSLVYAHFIRFGLCFGLGVAALQYQRFLIVHWSGILLLFAFTVLLRETSFYSIALYTITAYSTLWLAFIPGGAIRLFNYVGDYSYGIYIYAYPVQQTLINLYPNLLPLQMLILTIAATLPLAMASWHFIEKPSLQVKKQVGELLLKLVPRRTLKK